MSVVEVLAPGLFTMVQDLGRPGFGAMGVSASGAADAIALRLGNRLVGNEENAAGLEMTLVGGTFRFPQGNLVSLTGSDFDATLDGSPVPVWTSLKVRPGQTLAMGATRSGARGYLCVHGGIVVELFLGSSSTHALSGLGGFEGRMLRKGDVLNVGVWQGTGEDAPYHNRAIATDVLRRLMPGRVLRVTAGPQSDWFDASSRRQFYEHTFRVAEESNRMGLRLEGASIPAPMSREMITEGVSLGAIQVPAGGQPIILFVEQQTTGGYPKIANVISADLHTVGQLRPRDEIRFELVDMETARSLLKEQESLLSSSQLLLT
jgi:antagonist of KipI